MKKFLMIAGFAESVLNFRWDLICAVQAKGLEVHIAAPEILQDVPTREKLQAQGFILHNVPMQRTGTNPLEDLKTLLALRQLMQQIKPDYVLAYTIKPVIYGMLAAKSTGVPHRIALITGLGYAFQDTDNSAAKSWIRRITRGLYKQALASAEVTFFQNDDDQKLFADLGITSPGQHTIVVNGSGVNTEKFSPQPLPEGNEIHFLLIGRLLKDKGVREYVDAARKVKQKHPHAVFNMVGFIDINPSSVTQTELDQWINEGTIKFWGKLSDVRPALNACHVFVLPSYREGTPRTVLEAMATGRAIITTDAPGCRQTVDDGYNGFLVPVQSSEKLAEAMERFITQPDLIESMRQASLEIVKTKYDVNIINDFMLRNMNI
ncbi:glycosyltransferase family 4 protein [Neisseria wadsworthii]|uniref:Pilin glycosyltransferase n=1 Tax=Neisseria wadsworthii 9715 TaxID=1030841 RepID=G4CPN6_9NEIS|nr:glycosyltransferase family 4 protein [Neisseria wadsworthii]EGZ47606.1 pilin glycosyltransferase [Neisseria wadsworthii 9715]QMT34839.1 glycosyltransferase family 4 protein [Neisseria wadsworthii]